MKDIYVDSLNDRDKNVRLDALRKLMLLYETGALEKPITGRNVNNHIHTTYSFSPYSPTMAVFRSWQSGLATTGIMDHDSVAGAFEFATAGEILKMPVTVGFELRCSMTGTPFEGRRINNPDQDSVVYLAMHGIPQQSFSEAELFLAPFREKRNIRNWKMVDRLNNILRPYGLELDFTNDVLPLSEYSSGGSVTERHILYALAAKISQEEMPRHFLLGMFKSQLVENFYVDAVDELPHIRDFISLADKLGAIPAYAYLGDVGVSVTRDKRSQKFEDAYLDELMVYLKEIGVRAVTYMPTRNSDAQLSWVKKLCVANGLFQISGEDINSPLQRFICDKIELPEFEHLIDSAWALVGHEIACTNDLSAGMFSEQTVQRFPDLDERITHFAELAKDKFRIKRKV
ncbi:MAG: PHP domain-containing protein [Oscillospiraceae bacterium]|nr:PHP domain-containing protein [Oscillospiraceae bacterium]MCL2278987.1 PHP domain-containing protein [Oscillospiraceae bacterium]